MKNYHIFSRFARLAGAAAVLLTLSSCEQRAGQLSLEILTNTVWCEAESNTGASTDTATEGSAAERLYSFDEGGVVATYTVSGNTAIPAEEYRYIFTPAEELLAIESVGAFKVEDIDVDVISLEDIESGKPFRLTKYTGEATLPQ
jgi:hypothetical protein